MNPYIGIVGRPTIPKPFTMAEGIGHNITGEIEYGRICNV